MSAQPSVVVMPGQHPDRLFRTVADLHARGYEVVVDPDRPDRLVALPVSVPASAPPIWSRRRRRP